jgi:hypothetical protein
MPSDVPFEPSAIPISPKDDAVPDAASATGIFAAVTDPAMGKSPGNRPENPGRNTSPDSRSLMAGSAAGLSDIGKAESPEAESPKAVEASMRRPVPVVREIVLRPAGSPSGNPEAGEFSRVFQPYRETAPGQQAAQSIAPEQSSTPEPTRASRSESPGEFTRLFQSGVGTPAAAASNAAPPSANTAADRGSLDISQILRSLDRPQSSDTGASFPAAGPSAPPVAQAHQDAAGFTELFRQFSDGRAFDSSSTSEMAAAAPATSAQGQASPAEGADTESFTQIFKSVAYPPFESSTPPLATPFGASGFPAQAEIGSTSDANSFTQIMNRLSHPNAGPAKADGEMTALPNPATPLPQPSSEQQTFPESRTGPGTFTKLMSSLEQPPAAVAGRSSVPLNSPNESAGGAEATAIFATPQKADPPPAPQPAGPSEYTRVISRSAARELQQSAPASPVQPAPTFAPPQQIARPQVPTAAPQARAAMPMPPAMQPPQAQVPPFAMPVGASPQMAPLPQAPPPAAPAMSKLQQYMPLLLIANAVLMVILICLVIFAMKHH